MAQLYGVDVSEFQGRINWDQLNAVSNFVMIRASFGTARKDNQFTRNQSEARRVRASAGPLGIGYYYFAYAELLDPVTSANFFVDNLGDLAEGEILALDLEGQIGNVPVNWSLNFLNQCEARTGVKPLIYLNQSILNGYDWSPVIKNGNGLWIAQYDGKKTGGAVSGRWPFAAMKQWTDADIVLGISGKVDGDTFYGDFQAFAAYGLPGAPMPVPTTTTTTTLPAPPPPPVTESTTTTTTTESSTTTTTLPPSPGPVPNPLPVPPPVPPEDSYLSRLFQAIIAWFKNIFK